MNKLWFLRRLDLLEGMSDVDMERLASVLKERECRVGEEVVVRPSGDRVYLVKEGRVSVMDDGVAVAILGPGQLFGTSALFGAAMTGQRVVALEDVVVCEAPAAQFLAAMTLHPRLASKVVTNLARQLFELERSVERVARTRVEQRLADLLLRLARAGEGRREVRGVSQADLARMVGAARESVSRTIAGWERTGIVRAGQRFIEIVDEVALRKLLR